MEVILMERVERLGQIGDVVNVKPGFARNFLLPRGKALRATEANKKVFEAQRSQLEADNLKRKDEAAAVADKLDGLKVVLIRQAGEAGQLYGSANARDVAAAVTAAGFTVGRSQVQLAQPIKTVGLHDVRIALHPEVAVTVVANVARSQDEAVQQAETGRAVTGGMDEEPEVDVDDLVDVETAEHIHEDEAAEAEEDAEETSAE